MRLFLLTLLAISQAVASTHPLPLVVDINSDDFDVVYDYSDVHMLSFGVPIEQIKQFAKYFYLDAVFVDVPVDQVFLQNKFGVETIPHVMILNANQSRHNETIFHMKPPYTTDSMHLHLLKYKSTIEMINVLPRTVQYEWAYTHNQGGR